MARISLCILLLSTVLGFSQQPLPNQAPPATSTSADNNPSSPPQAAPQDQSKAGANQRIQSSLEDLLGGDPILNGVDVQASVNDESIILTGTVDSYAQHQRVLQLAAQYGRWRKIDDKIKMK